MDKKIEVLLTDYTKSLVRIVFSYMYGDITLREYRKQGKMLNKNYVLKVKNLSSLHKQDNGTGGDE